MIKAIEGMPFDGLRQKFTIRALDHMGTVPCYQGTIAKDPNYPFKTWKDISRESREIRSSVPKPVYVRSGRKQESSDKAMSNGKCSKFKSVQMSKVPKLCKGIFGIWGLDIAFAIWILTFDIRVSGYVF